MLQKLQRLLCPSSVWALSTTVLEALALMSVALWNGYPILFYDTVAYLPGWWQDGQKAVAYQGLRPTLSIDRAQMIEAMTPTPEVIQP